MICLLLLIRDKKVVSIHRLRHLYQLVPLVLYWFVNVAASLLRCYLPACRGDLSFQDLVLHYQLVLLIGVVPIS